MHLALFIPIKKGMDGKVLGVCSLYFIFAYTFAGSPDSYRDRNKKSVPAFATASAGKPGRRNHNNRK